MLRFLILAAAALCLAACGDDATGSTSGDAGSDGAAGPGTDGGAVDAEPPAPVDAGPPPACTLTTTSTTFASGFGGTRDAMLEALVAVAPEGPFAYGWRSGSEMEATRRMRVEVGVVGADGALGGRAELGEVSGDTTRIGQIALAPAGGGVLVAWEQAESDAEGRVIASEIRHGAVGADGSVTRAEAVLYDSSAVPVVAADPPDDLWLLRSQLDLMGATTGVIPQIQHLDANGAAVADAVRAQSFLRIEATEVALEPRESGPVLAYRVPPSTALVVSLDRTPVPARPEKMVFDVPFLDDVAAREDAIALGWSETAGGVAHVGVAVTDSDGVLRGRADLDSFDADYQAHVAVVAAWPGFVAVWRAGAGGEARLRAAGLDVNGNVLVPPTDLAAVPDLDGDVLAVTDGAVLTVGYRVTPPDTMSSLGMTRACGPR